MYRIHNISVRSREVMITCAFAIFLTCIRMDFIGISPLGFFVTSLVMTAHLIS